MAALPLVTYAGGHTGGTHNFAILEDNSLWGWGNNDLGQIGVPVEHTVIVHEWEGEVFESFIDHRLSPVRVMDDVIEVSVGGLHTAVIRGDNSLWIWGMLWRESDFEAVPPTKIMDDVRAISAGTYGIMAITNDNSLWVISIFDFEEPRKVMDDVADVSIDFFGDNRITVVKIDGSLWQVSSWWWEDSWETANIEKIMDGVVAVHSGSSFILAIKTDGSLWELRHGSEPVHIMDNVQAATSIGGAESRDSCQGFALKTDGTLWTWGSRAFVGTQENIETPVMIMENVAAVSAYGTAFTINISILKTDGSLLTWGNNDFGQLGNGTNISAYDHPIHIMDGVKSISGSLGVTALTPTPILPPPPTPALILPPPPTPAPDIISVTIDGVQVYFADQPPAIVDNRTLVPVRGVFETLGFEVDWNRETQTATLKNESFVVTITIGSPTFTTNGVSHALDVPAQIIGGRTMLPIRAVLESVGYNVEWDNTTRTVVITS